MPGLLASELALNRSRRETGCPAVSPPTATPGGWEAAGRCSVFDLCKETASNSQGFGGPLDPHFSLVERQRTDPAAVVLEDRAPRSSTIVHQSDHSINGPHGPTRAPSDPPLKKVSDCLRRHLPAQAEKLGGSRQGDPNRQAGDRAIDLRRNSCRRRKMLRDRSERDRHSCFVWRDVSLSCPRQKYPKSKARLATRSRRSHHPNGGSPCRFTYTVGDACERTGGTALTA